MRFHFFVAVGITALSLAPCSAQVLSAWKSVGRPPMRWGSAMAFDRARVQVVLHAGLPLDGFELNDTWIWNGSSWSIGAPAAGRAWHAMAAIDTQQKILLFGGAQGPAARNDTWEWDGTRWSSLTPASMPSGRFGHAMAYDSARNRVVLFGGGPAHGLGNRETWEWDGTNWLRAMPMLSPPGRFYAGMAYDRQRQRTVLVGGTLSSNLKDTWEWDGVNWAPGPAVPTSETLEGQMLAYDEARSVMVLVADGSTFELQAGGWTRITVSPAPLRRQHSVVWDPANRVVLLHGGQGGLDDTWVWNGTVWTDRSVPRPPMSLAPACAFDPVRGRSLTVVNGETWEWDGMTWSQRAPQTSGLPLQPNAITFDLVRQRAVVHNGGQTWEWDGTSWRRIPTTGGPPPGVSQGLAWDGNTGRVLLFGGAGPSFNETWLWDGTNWTKAQPLTSPPAGAVDAMVWDSARRRVVIPSHLAQGNTWEWNGSDWTLRSTAAPRTVFHSAAFDADRALIVMVGGGMISQTDAVWEWNGTTWSLGLRLAGPGRASPGVSYDTVRGRLLVHGGFLGSTPVTLGDTWELAVPCVSVGDGNPGGSPGTLACSAAPMLGQSFTVQWSGVPAANSLLVLALGPCVLPAPMVGGLFCQPALIYPNLNPVLFVDVPMFGNSVTFAVPNNPFLADKGLCSQAVALASSGCILISNGMMIRIQGL